MNTLMFATHFTVKEANQLLPELAGLLEQIQNLQNELKREFPFIKQIAEERMFNTGFAGSDQYLDKSTEINRLVREISKTGVLVKDLKQGLIDFPHLSEGKEVLLCWKMGEKEVLYWHELDAGYAGRQSLYLDKKK
jgi:hypothetical protein